MGDEQLATENSRGELDAECGDGVLARDQRNQLRVSYTSPPLLEPHH